MIAIFASSLFFYFSFPNIFALQGFSFLAWVFAVPFLLALEGRNLGQRLGLGVTWGLIAHAALVNWFWSYNVVGFFAFVLALSLQTVVFAVLVVPGTGHPKKDFIYIPAAWVISEGMRQSAMRGFSWDVGHSQVFNILFLQSVDLFGSAGLYFLIILVNTSLYRMIRNPGERKFCLGIVVVVFAFLFSYGTWAENRYATRMPRDQGLDVCLVQPNIDFHQKQQLENVPGILAKTMALTRSCWREGHPELVLWPETAVPTDFRSDEEMQGSLRSFLQEKPSSLLLGAALAQGEKDYNSAVLLTPQADVETIYHKRYLVPFSEYAPLVQGLNRLSAAFGGYLFSAGQQVGIFSFQGIRLAVLICSEDTMAGLFREAVSQGAQGVIVLLNDGWFHYAAGLSLHAQQAIMHAVENRISVIRVANTGWSGFIDPVGRIHSGPLVFDQSGVWLARVYFPSTGTVYTRFAGIFYFFCLGFVIIIFGLRNFMDMKKRTSRV